MTAEERFEVNRWWASAPNFVLYALMAQLHEASGIWPELDKYRLVKSDDPPPPNATEAAQPVPEVAGNQC